MTDWARRIRIAAGRDDGSLLHRAAVQAHQAIEGSRAAWGERGVPYEMRGDEPIPEEEWVWLGDVLAAACTGRDDLATDTELLVFRIREDTPLEAALRLDRFRVAETLDRAGAEVRWIPDSGDPFLAKPAVTLLDRAFHGWERELERRFQDTADARARKHFARKGAWPRAVADDVLRALNAGRLERYVRLIRVAYAPDDELAERASRLSPGERLDVFSAIADQRALLISPRELAPLLEDADVRGRARALSDRLSGRDPSDRATG